MTIVTITFPDERTKSAHTHAKFSTDRDATVWVYWMIQRFGPLEFELETDRAWFCSSCGMQSRALPKAKVAAGRSGFTDLE